MVIGIDASRANREFKTGTEWYSYYLIINIVKLDKNNKYILYSDRSLSESFLKDLDLEKNKHVKIKVLSWPFKALWTLGRLSLEMIFNRPQVLFVPAHSLPLFFPKKTVTTIHDIAFLKDSCLYNPHLSNDLSQSSKKTINFFTKFLTGGKYCSNATDYLKWSTRFALKKAKKILTVSHFTKKDILANYRVKESKIKVVHNGYNHLLYKEINDQAKIKEILLKYGLQDPFLLYVGRLEKKKNIHRLIEAWSLLKEENPERPEKLILIGSAGYGYDEIRYQISDWGLEKEVVILGWVEEKDLPYIFNGAQLFVFPSLYEGFGIPVLQAMAVGLPALLSDIEVLREVAGEGAFFFDPLDFRDLAEKIKEGLDNENLRKELKEYGLNRAKNFSWEKCAQKTLEQLLNFK